jgi:hypothetical protein
MDFQSNMSSGSMSTINITYYLLDYSGSGSSAAPSSQGPDPDPNVNDGEGTPIAMQIFALVMLGSLLLVLTCLVVAICCLCIKDACCDKYPYMSSYHTESDSFSDYSGGESDEETNSVKWEPWSPLKEVIRETQIAESEFCDNPVCTICLEEVTKEQQLSQLECRHIFHSECISDWHNSSSNWQKSCPICREDMTLMEVIIHEI